MINIDFTLIQMHFQVNNGFCCETESKAALKKLTRGEGIRTGHLNFSNFFNNIFGFLLIVSIMNDYTFDLEQILNIVHLNWLTINAFVRGR